MYGRIAARVVVVMAGLLGLTHAEAQTLPSGFQASLVASVAAPTAIAFTPDGRLLITSQRGQLRVYQHETLLPTPALDLASVICANSERGLLGVAVDPSFASNRYIYLFYTFNRFGTCVNNAASSPVNRVSRFTLLDDNTVNRASELILLDNIPSPNGNHNGGDLFVGRDGLLYVTVGDGGCDYRGDSGCAGANDAARDLHVLLGKVLRITRTGGIPAGNPYLGTDSVRCNTTGRANPGQKCQETFAWGLRNPFRFAFDPNATGTRFFINDVGQNTWEEIDEGRAGADYGWNVREGHCANGSTTNCGTPPAGMTNPIFDYPHANGCASITGGAFVPAGVWPAQYAGSYLFSDYVCGTIFRLARNSSGAYTSTTFATGLGASSAVAMTFGPFEGTQALYYTTYASGGQVRRIAYTANQAPVASATATPRSGPVPLTVQFNASASSDPDSDPLTFEWVFGDGTGPVNGATTSHTYSAAGTYTATVTVRDGRGGSDAESLVIDVGNRAPVPSILAPSSTARFAVGQQITLRGSASDPEDGTLSDNQLTWTVILHHDTHTHPFLGPTRGNDIVFTAPAPEDLAATTTSYLEIRLTATDSQGAVTTVRRDLLPRLVDVTVTSAPTNLTLTVNGTGVRTPRTLTSWEGYALTVSAQTQRDSTGQAWLFSSWSDGGAAMHTIITPAAAASYNATFSPAATVLPVADAYVRGGTYATQNFGSDTALHVKESADASYRRRAFLRLNVGNRTVGRAVLRLRGALTSAGNIPVAVYPVASTTWGESTITWNNQPAIGTTALRTERVNSTATRWYEWDITAYVRGELAAGRTAISLALVSTAATTPYAFFSSRNGSAANSPELLISDSTTTPSTGEVVLYGIDARTAGAWRFIADSTAAGGARVSHPNGGAAKLAAPLASPANYIELTFTASAGRPYRLWIRGRADANRYENDSAFVQFSGSVTASGAPTFRIGSTSATTYVLEDCGGCGLSGWGWQDNGYGTGVLGPEIYFAATGTQTIRIQTREDGLSIDQIVLSPSRYLSASPGTTKNDATILPKP